MSGNRIFYNEADQDMLSAFQKAQETFNYFWRELSWEYRRIIPGLDLACVKVAFTEETIDPKKPLVEHMWINEVGFDGDFVSGILVNNPNSLSNVKNGDFIEVPLTQVSDWLFVSQGKTYGGFTIQLMRSKMTISDREDHDKAWQLNFGDHRKVLLVSGQEEHPQHLTEHPMSINMRESLVEYLKDNPSVLNAQDEKGYTLLHRETIAGNRTSLEVLLNAGADRHATTHTGKRALDFARQLQWEHVIPLLES